MLILRSICIECQRGLMLPGKLFAPLNSSTSWFRILNEILNSKLIPYTILPCEAYLRTWCAVHSPAASLLPSSHVTEPGHQSDHYFTCTNVHVNGSEIHQSRSEIPRPRRRPRYLVWMAISYVHRLEEVSRYHKEVPRSLSQSFKSMAS